MATKKVLHIANGDDIFDRLQTLKIPGEVLIWREMLCEGPTTQDITSAEFRDMRQQFLEQTYGISAADYHNEFISELVKLDTLNSYDEIILWFEFDLFSHINMLAAISHIVEREDQVPIHLVCSGWVKGEHELLPLSELNQKQFQEHYQRKMLLTQEDLETASLIWEIYCSKNPLRIKAEIKKTSNFQYLSSCLRAHIERFPNARTGLNSLETNVLKLVEQHSIKTENQLLGYALKYQGYYGYDDVQMQRVLDKVSPFISETQEGIKLSQKGEQALGQSKNFYQELREVEYFGGAQKYQFLYDPDSHTLMKL